MSERRFTLCRAQYLLPLASPDRSLRIEDGYVLAEGEKIREVGPYTPEVERRLLSTLGPALEVLRPEPRGADGGGLVPRFRGVLMPAFVKAHGHDHEQALIGVAKDEPLTEWLDHAVNPFSAFMKRDGARLRDELGYAPHYVAYRMARLADIHYGITASMVHHCNYNKYHVREMAEANVAARTTMIIAVGAQDRFYVEEILDRPEDALARLDATLTAGPYPRTSFCPGPDQLFSNSRKILVPLKAWAREHGTLFHIHSSEEPRTTAWFQREIEPGMTPVQYAESIGILDERSVLAHQVHCGPQDLEILARTGTRIVHNPLANTILGSGMPPVIEMLAAGIPVAISTDGSGSADNQNILAAARLAAQYQKAAHQDARLLPAPQLLEMITSVPASILGFDQGELAVGRQADWVVLGLDRPNLCPTRLDNVMENVIWAADGSEVDTVVAHGEVLKINGRILPFADGASPEQIMADAQYLSEGFAEYRRSAPELKGTGAHR